MSGEFSQLSQAGRVPWGAVQTLLNRELGNPSATLLNWQSIHTKKGSIVHELTPTTARGSAATHSADIFGKEVNNIALSVGFPPGSATCPAHQSTMETQASIQRSKEGLQLPTAASRSRCGLIWQMKLAFLLSTLGSWSSLAKGSFLNSCRASL